jgi:hypothetical protein
MRVMLKSEWLEFKKTVSSIKQEVNQLTFGARSQKPKELSEFETGSLVEITGSGLQGMTKK